MIVTVDFVVVTCNHGVAGALGQGEEDSDGHLRNQSRGCAQCVAGCASLLSKKFNEVDSHVCRLWCKSTCVEDMLAMYDDERG